MPQNTKYKALISLFKDCRKKQIVLFILCLFSIITNILLVYQIQNLINSAVNHKSKEYFCSILIRTVILGFITFLATSIQTQKWHLFRNELINKMRIRMYEKMLEKDASFFDSKTTGDIASGILNDGSSIAESAGINILMFWLNILQIIIIISIMIHLNPILGCIVLIISLLYYFLINLLNREMRNSYREERQEFATLTQFTYENISAIYDIKVMDKASFFLKKFSDNIWNKYFKKIKKVISIQVRMFSINTVMKVILPVMVIASGVYYSYYGIITIGTLVIFYTYVGMLIEPLNNLADFNQGKQMALGAAERVYNYLFEESKATVENNIYIQNVENLHIKIESFCRNDKEILHDINEVLIPGDRILIKGESGCGKTTLIKLICNLYDLKMGEILINNTNISSIAYSSFYSIVKILFQEPFVLEGSILDNLTLGDAFEEEAIWNVLHTACLDDFVKEHGLDYMLNEKGKNLSGGQRQRLCLARVLLRKPKILLLDEATSALDEETENKLLQELLIYVQNNNIILVAVSHSNLFGSICNKELYLSRL